MWRYLKNGLLMIIVALGGTLLGYAILSRLIDRFRKSDATEVDNSEEKRGQEDSTTEEEIIVNKTNTTNIIDQRREKLHEQLAKLTTEEQRISIDFSDYSTRNIHDKKVIEHYNDWKEKLPLIHYVARYCSPKIVRAFITKQNHAEVYKEMYQYKYNKFPRIDMGLTTLHMATLNPNIDSFKEIMSLWSDVSPRTNPNFQCWFTPFHMATSIGRIDIMMLLYNKGVDIDAISTKGSPFILAAQNGDVLALNLLCKWGASRKGNSIGGRSAIECASRFFNEDNIRSNNALLISCYVEGIFTEVHKQTYALILTCKALHSTFLENADYYILPKDIWIVVISKCTDIECQIVGSMLQLREISFEQLLQTKREAFVEQLEAQQLQLEQEPEEEIHHR